MLKSNAVTGFFSSVIDEGKKVIWPSRTTIINHGVMVVSTVVLSTLLVAGVDYCFQQLLILVLNNG